MLKTWGMIVKSYRDMELNCRPRRDYWSGFCTELEGEISIFCNLHPPPSPQYRHDHQL
jgi:hypothetical protein